MPVVPMLDFFRKSVIARVPGLTSGAVKVDHLQAMTTPRHLRTPRQQQLVTPRQGGARDSLPPPDSADCDIEIEDQVLEYRNFNRTDSELWADLKPKYPSMARCLECLSAPRPSVGGRRDYSLLVEGLPSARAMKPKHVAIKAELSV